MTSRNGLGLFICHSMVQLLRGEIRVASKEGESAEFIVTLPYLEAEETDLDEQDDEKVPVVQPVSAVAAETEVNIGNPVILVVDDNRDIVWLIKETLSFEYVVREAFNAEEALALMEQQTPDLIITDIMMPSMDGFALISRIKSDKFTRHIPLIVVSAKVSENEQAEGLDLGADAYLTKPFSVEELLARIRTTLRRLSYAQTGGVASEGSFDTGELHIDFDAGIATMAGEELHLTPIEYKLLCLLAHNADKVLTHQFILHEIWGTATKSDLASLRVFMGTLRKKIESDPAHPRYIQTHVGIGYRLVTHD